MKSGIVSTHNDSICHIGFRDNPPTIRIYIDIEMNLNRILFLTNPTYPHETVCKNYTDRTLEFCMETQTMLYPVKIAASFFTRYSYSAANMKTKCGGLCKVRLLQIPWGIFLSRTGKIG